MHLRRYSLLIIAVVTLIPLYSQFNTYSPYTRFGLGDLSKQGFGQNQAMGGTGLAIHEGNRINYLNPAASSALDSTSVYFDFGANAFFNQYLTEGDDISDMSNSWWNMNLHHVAFASSMGKNLGFSAGIVPYSSIGYSIKQEYNDYMNGNAMDTYYSGDGGIMNFYLGTSVKLFDRVAVGVTMNYLMGKLTRNRQVEFPMNSSYSDASSEERLDIRKPVFSFGMQYKEVISEKFFLSLGATYDLATDVNTEHQYELINSIYPYEDIDLDSVTTITPAYVLESDTVMGSFTLPQKIGVGIAIGIPDKLIVTGDYYRQDWAGALSGNGYKTAPASSFHFGTEYTPDKEAIRGYHKLATYRLGAYYSNSYLSVLKGGSQPGDSDGFYQLNDYGITFGLGLPVRTLRSSINVAFTAGTRGATEYNLVKENYGIITFNVTLHDLWFRKRRFD
ncbi:MAG: hypothetical protein GY790_22740 [Bacteroidetes bacterium]|nr:hypothetical protein [Bacteroidota bacterium]